MPILRTRLRAPQAAVVALAAITALTVHAVLNAADSARRRWGNATTVVVSRHHIDAGVAIGSGDVERRSLPNAAIPDGALQAIPDGAIAAGPVERGEIFVPDRLVDTRRAPAGTRAMTLALGEARPPIHVGDHVDLIATFDAGQPAVVVATDVLVVDVAEAAATFAVPHASELLVAAAIRQSQVVVAISATPSRPG